MISLFKYINWNNTHTHTQLLTSYFFFTLQKRIKERKNYWFHSGYKPYLSLDVHYIFPFVKLWAKLQLHFAINQNKINQINSLLYTETNVSFTTIIFKFETYFLLNTLSPLELYNSDIIILRLMFELHISHCRHHVCLQ